MGVRKTPWYFLVPSYWGFGESHVTDNLGESIEASTDEDVIAEENKVRARANQPMDPQVDFDVHIYVYIYIYIYTNLLHADFNVKA
jgi:hypothetical protein